MPPVPCSHCGFNFMRNSLNPYAANLCNNCVIAENIRNNKKACEMEESKILISCSKEMVREIEEFCLMDNLSFSDYFKNLHEENKEFYIKNSTRHIEKDVVENKESCDTNKKNKKK